VATDDTLKGMYIVPELLGADFINWEIWGFL